MGPSQVIAVSTQVVILLGAPGAGKGTQASRLSERRSLPHVSTGDLFRSNVAKGTELGRRAKGFMERGELVPDDIVLDLLFERVRLEDCEAGYVLDGFPRTLPQAIELERRLDGDAELAVVEIAVPDEVIVRRIAGRLVCKGCGNVQHALYDPPAEEGVCDECGGELVQRPDDRPEVVHERLRVYHEQTAPLVRYYEEKGLLSRVDGERSPDAVFAELDRAVPRGRG
jgi:adenylate kinase